MTNELQMKLLVACDKFGAKTLVPWCIVGIAWELNKMREDQCRMNLFRLQEIAFPEVKLDADFVICTWKVRFILFEYSVSQNYLAGG